MKTTAKDVMLLCKGWYDKEKYPTILEALKEYYRKYYNENYEDYLGERFLLKTVIGEVMNEIIKYLPDRLPLFARICMDNNSLTFDLAYGTAEITDYSIVLFYCIVRFLSEIQPEGNGKVIIDMSDYFDKNHKLKEDII